MDIEIEKCWQVYELAKNMSNMNFDNSSSYNDRPIKNGFCCNNCGYEEYDTDNVCTNCGLINNNIQEYDIQTFQENEPVYAKTVNYTKTTSNFNKINKMKQWYSSTNEEKNDYKLVLYTKELCEKLNINYHVSYITDLVINILKLIKSADSSKRCRVKDGIIIVCIFYTYKNFNLHNDYKFTLYSLAKKINLNVKYISKAETSILELVNKRKIDLNKNILLNINDIYSFIPGVKQQFINLNHNLSKEHIDLLFNNLKVLINKLEKNEYLSNHAPFSVVIGSLYYILNKQMFNIDLHMFSKLYNISNVTILKINSEINLLKFD